MKEGNWVFMWRNTPVESSCVGRRSRPFPRVAFCEAYSDTCARRIAFHVLPCGPVSVSAFADLVCTPG
jgi:hypothetical protein